MSLTNSVDRKFLSTLMNGKTPLNGWANGLNLITLIRQWITRIWKQFGLYLRKYTMKDMCTKVKKFFFIVQDAKHLSQILKYPWITVIRMLPKNLL
ncbi:hypothetical protein ES703_107251 [subsurface metagenome]